MKYVTHTINENGLNQIKEILMTNHKKFQDVEPTQNMLFAWASDVEQNLNTESGACFEIKSWDHVLGRVEEFTITAQGYDCEEVEE